MSARPLRSGELAEQAGVGPQTLRYYERRGLLPAPERSLGGHRRYPARAVATVRTIKAAQQLGFTLDEISRLLGPAGHGDAGLSAHAGAKLAEIDRRIADLTAHRQILAAAIEAGCDDLAVCAKQPACPLSAAGIAT